MHIGLIGGIGPAATDFYYRSLIGHAARAHRDLDLTIVHADTPTLLRHLTMDDAAAQCAIYQRLTARLQAAGAQCVAVTSIAGHFCIDEFAPASALPVIDLTRTLADWLGERSLNQVGILGTETVMASGMFGKLDPINLQAPQGDAMVRVHDAYVTLAQTGEPTDELRNVFCEEGNTLMDQGAEAILLGGTDLNAVLADDNSPFPIVDCAGIHINAIARGI